ncbi:uncharacterized protein [Elaeis guineensis]|uniref:uncharacterized protein isoform X2 n=1 Tax=Elaeis guineensis var. tenera TaxID=51953 RepID=UPI003C6D3BFF
MTSTMESIIESLQRTCQLMVQEVERSANTLATFEESTSVLKKAEGEYKGHRSLLMRTRRLLSTMQCQDVMDSCRGSCLEPSRKVQKDMKRWLWKSRERQLEIA